MSQRVKVVGAPGYADHAGTVIPGLHRYRLVASAEPVSVILPDATPTVPHVIPSEFVFDIPEEESE